MTYPARVVLLAGTVTLALVPETVAAAARMDWLGLATFVTALAGAFVAIYTALRQGKTAKVVDVHTALLTEIKTDVNSNAAAQEERVKRGEERIKELTDAATLKIEAQMATLKADALAHAAAAIATRAADDLRAARYEAPPRRRR